MAKQPLYPHKTPSQLAAESVNITREFDGNNDYEALLFQVGYENPIVPKEKSGPVFYHEVFARIDDIGRINYVYIPAWKIGYIAEINVLENRRGSGYGRQMLEFAIKDMKRHGIKNVAAGDVTQMGYNLFKALGFSIINKSEPYQVTRSI